METKLKKTTEKKLLSLEIVIEMSRDPNLIGKCPEIKRAVLDKMNQLYNEAIDAELEKD